LFLSFYVKTISAIGIVFSNDYKIVRVLALVLRFVNCRKERIGQCMGRILQYKEILLAENAS
jgi:hypothetical protein